MPRRDPAVPGAGGVGRPGRRVHRRLPDGVARGLAAARGHRPDPVGPRPRRRRCWRRAPGCASWRSGERAGAVRLSRCSTPGPHDGAGRRPARARPPRRAALGLARRGGGDAGEPAGRQPREAAGAARAGVPPRRAGARGRHGDHGRRHRRPLPCCGSAAGPSPTGGRSPCRPGTRWRSAADARGAALLRRRRRRRRGRAGAGLAGDRHAVGPRPAAAAAGRRAPVGRPRSARAGDALVHAASRPRPPGRPGALRCAPGPRADWFTDGASTPLTRPSTPWRRTPTGSGCGWPAAAGARPPRGAAERGHRAGRRAGAADGRPLVFLNDHPTTGGYPVVAVVDPADLPGARSCGRATGSASVRRDLASGDGPGTLARCSAGSSAGTCAPARARSRRSRTAPSPGRRRSPTPSPAVLGVHHVHAGVPAALVGEPVDSSSAAVPRSLARALRRVGASLASPNRSSWIQSASPETPTPSRRTPSMVSTSPSSAVARAPAPRGSSVGTRQRGRAGVGREVVQPHLDRHRPARQPRRAQPLGHLPRLPLEQPLEQPPLDQVGVVGVLDADRLRLPLGDHRPVVVGAGQPVEPVAVRLAHQPHQLVLGDRRRGPRRASPRPGAAARRWPARRRGSPSPAAGRGLPLGAGRDDDEPVGLAEVAGDLRHQLRGADPHRAGEPAGDRGRAP